MPTRNREIDACPGVLAVHQANDGGVARIRVPGGQLTAEQFAVLADAAATLGNGTIELTSRANLQVRGLTDGVALSERLATVGLLPSATHERVRNITASPLTGRDRATDVRPLVTALDAGLCADPLLAELPGRFQFAVDDGRGDVAWSGADVALIGDAVLLGGVDSGLRGDPVALALACARQFLALRTTEWRLVELPDGPRRIAALVGSPVPPQLTGSPVTHLRLGRVDQVDGRVALVAGAPLGRLNPAQAAALTGVDLVITPWRSIVVADLADAGPVADRLLAAGLHLDPDTPQVTACVGRPGCAKALADVQADAKPLPGVSLPVHWSGCERRCGRPHGAVVDMVATETGYLRQGDR